MINKSLLSINDQKDVKNEIDALRKLDHRNIVNYFEVYENEYFISIVMEYCPGGELFDSPKRLVKKNLQYTEL